MKNIFKFIICLTLLASCQEENSLLDDIAINGGYILFEETVPDNRIDLSDLDTSEISQTLIDPNNNAISYSLDVYYNGATFEDAIVITSSFPTELKITVADLERILGVDRSEFTEESVISFVATVESTTGTYSALTPEYLNNSVSVGGQTVNRLKTIAQHHAMVFDVTFYTPPPYHIRRTSFEEPEGAASEAKYTFDAPYNVFRVLLNNIPGEPIVTYDAVGTSRDHELGFTTEFEPASTSDSTPGFTSSSIGVTTQANRFSFFPDGVQGFKIEDVDGLFRMKFDKVDVPSGVLKTGVQIRAFFYATGWETSDFLYVFAKVKRLDGSEAIITVVEYVSGNDIEVIDGSWITYDTGYLDNIASYEITLEASSSVTAEEIYWDNLVVYMPEP